MKALEKLSRENKFYWPRGHEWRHRSGQSQNVRHFGLGDIGEQNCDVKHKQSQLIGMDSVSDICKYHLLCFMTIIEVKVMSGHLVKKVKQKKFSDLELRYMFLGQISQWTRKMTPKLFLKHQNRSKNKIRNITVKSRNDVKSTCFWHVLCHISAIFEDINLKFCTHIHQSLPSNILSGFLKILILRGKFLKKKKNCWKFWKFWGMFKMF